MRARRGIAWLAGTSLLLMLAVLGASAQIRAGPAPEALAVLRATHRLCASTVALMITVLAVLAWRAPGLRAAGACAFILMLALSAVGWAAGTAPPPAAAFFNQLGGLALAALLALLWAHARAAGAEPGPEPGPLSTAALLFALAQAAFGSVLAAFAPDATPLVVVLHAAAGLAACAVVAALRTAPALACALLAPLTGAAAAMPVMANIAPSAHALSAALLLAAAGAAQGRRT